jgi:hypothetical protein
MRVKRSQLYHVIGTPVATNRLSSLAYVSRTDIDFTTSHRGCLESLRLEPHAKIIELGLEAGFILSLYYCNLA